MVMILEEKPGGGEFSSPGPTGAGGQSPGPRGQRGGTPNRGGGQDYGVL